MTCRYLSLLTIFGILLSAAPSFANETFVHPLIQGISGYPGTNSEPAWTFKPGLRPVLATDKNAKFFCSNNGYSNYDASRLEKGMFYAVGGSGTPVVYDIESAPAYENLSSQERDDPFSEAREQALMQGQPYQKTDNHMSYGGEIIFKITCTNTK